MKNKKIDYKRFNFPKRIDSLIEWRAFRDYAFIVAGNDWTDKDYSHSYLGLYWQLLRGNLLCDRSKDENKIKKVLEIGIKHGYSLCLWNCWFDRPKITGVDIDTSNLKICNYPRNIEIIESDIKKIKKIKNRKYDFIIDDGSHTYEDQLYTLNNYYKNLNDKGVLIIEDIENSDTVKKLAENFVGEKENLLFQLGETLPSSIDTFRVPSPFPISTNGQNNVLCYYKCDEPFELRGDVK